MDDRTLRQNVLSKLTTYHLAPSVAVAVEQGVVSLYGEVASASERLAIEATCLRVTGVRAVVQHLAVRSPAILEADDRRIALTAVDALGALHDPATGQVGLSVADGVVTLRGEVGDEHQRAAAEQCVRTVSGVADVHNLLTLRSQAPTGDAAAWVRETVARQNLQIREFRVESRLDDTMRLSGQTFSWRDRDAAERAAWSAPGVRAVDNRIALLASALDPEAEWSGMREV